MKIRLFSFLLVMLMAALQAKACSILYYIDKATGKIYAVNNEDYWYHVKAYIQITPADEKHLGRLWYGWDNFAQGGINQAGLFFDGATTPDQPLLEGYSQPKNKLGDAILSRCKTVDEAIAYVEQHRIALTNGHLLFGDRSGNAVVMEWVNGKRNLIPIADNKLMITNFLLSDTTKGNYPCPRYEAMEDELTKLKQSQDTVSLKQVGNILAKAIQPAAKDPEGREGGTLYSSFINITDMEFILVYKLDHSRMTQLDLKKELTSGKKRVIKLK